MKTAVLNATDQRILSVSTAEDQADRRHECGDDGDPDRVVLDRGDEDVRREQRLVVVEPDEVVALAVVEAAPRRVDRRVDDPDAEQERGRQRGTRP